MSFDDMDDAGRDFLLQIYQKTNGNTTAQVSMYDIGEKLGLERESASRVAEDLIANQLVEIRTLSGGIGISDAGVQEIQTMTGMQLSGDNQITPLGTEKILDQNGSQAVRQVVDDLKDQAGNLGLDFDTLGELMADINTVSAQLASSRPKIAIIKECLRSLLGVAERANDNESLARISVLLGE
jgi:hypothetical protein